MKVSTHITIDVQKKIKIKELGYVLSEIVEEAITNKINFHSQDIEALNIEATKLDLEILEKKQSKINQKACQLREKIAKFEEKMMENEKKRLENEKNLIENSKKCIECGNIIEESNDKYHKFDKGLVCHPCFMTCSTSIGKWRSGN